MELYPKQKFWVRLSLWRGALRGQLGTKSRYTFTRTAFSWQVPLCNISLFRCFFKCNLCFPKNWNWNSETEIRMTTTRSIWAAVQIHAFCLCSSYNCSLAAPLEDGKCSHSPYSLYPRSNKSLKAATFPPLPSACGSGLSVDCQGLFHFCFSFPGSWLTPECPFRLSI